MKEFERFEKDLIENEEFKNINMNPVKLLHMMVLVLYRMLCLKLNTLVMPFMKKEKMLPMMFIVMYLTGYGICFN